MNEILLVNPARRRRRKTTTRKRRRTVARRSRRRNPVANPTHRPRRRTVARSRRRNPRARVFTAAKLQKQLMTAAQGALGALGLDIALAYIPLPPQMQGPFIGPVIKGAGAIMLGVVANMAGVRADTANRMAEGALTVQLHGIGKQMLGQFAPAIALSAYINDEPLGYYGSGWNPNAGVDDPDWQGGGMGTYLTDISADPMGIDEGGFSMYENEASGAEFAW